MPRRGGKRDRILFQGRSIGYIFLKFCFQWDERGDFFGFSCFSILHLETVCEGCGSPCWDVRVVIFPTDTKDKKTEEKESEQNDDDEEEEDDDEKEEGEKGTATRATTRSASRLEAER